MAATPFEVEVPGGLIRGKIYGDSGPAFLAVSGIGHSMSNWVEVAQHLETEARVITFDCRGHSQSTADVTDDGSELLRDLPRILAHFDIDKPIVLSHGLGGGIALLAALVSPDAFGPLCFVDSPVMDTQEQYAATVEFFNSPALMATFTERFGFGREGKDQESFEATVAELAARWEKDWVALTPKTDVARRVARDAILVRDDGSWIRRPTPETALTLVNLCGSGMPMPGRELLLSVDNPMWFIAPYDGTFVGSFSAIHEMAETRPTWATRSMEGGGDVVETHPEELARTVMGLYRDTSAD